MNLFPISYAFAASFSAGMAKRNAPGPFTAAPIVQGGWQNDGASDQLTYPTSEKIASYFTKTLDPYQGSASFWITPEWDSNDGKNHYFLSNAGASFNLYKDEEDNLVFSKGWSQELTISNLNWSTGSSYHIVLRWDRDNDISGSYNYCLTVNNNTECGIASSAGYHRPNTYLYIGSDQSGNYPANALIEGLTIYRRPLFTDPDDTPDSGDESGIDVGNGDEIEQIWNNGAGQDPTLVTGSWDVVFCMPTNSSVGELSTTGQAWTHPHAFNELYTDTSDTGGYMMDGDLEDEWIADDYVCPDSVEYNATTTEINAGNDSSLIDLHDEAFTAEAWVRADGYGENNTGYILAKSTGAVGWMLYLHNHETNGLIGYVISGTPAGSTAGTDEFSADGLWHHVAMTYDDGGDRTIKLFIDGTEVSSYPNQIVATGDIVSDVGVDFIIGNRPDNERAFDGAIAWSRVSNYIRSTGNFTPPSRFSPPDGDANTVAQWNMDEGTGTDVSNDGGTSSCGGTPANCNGTLSNGTWNDGGALDTDEKIFAGGYKWTNTAENQGIYQDISVSEGDDFVIRGLAHSDGTSIPKLIFYDQTNGAEIGSLTGTNTSTRTDPDVFIFTGEAPSGCSTIRVKLINTQSAGIVYWHQVEVLENLIETPSIEDGTDNGGTTTWYPEGWVLSSGLESGDTEQDNITIHSGTYSLKFNTTADSWLFTSVLSFPIYDYLAYGMWSYSDGSSYLRLADSYSRMVSQDTALTINRNLPSAASWSHRAGVVRHTSSSDERWNFYPRGTPTDAKYLDDVYSFQLTDVILTVTPADIDNSTENTDEIRVDGRDTYIDSANSEVTTTKGYLSWDWRPRHSASTASSFDESSDDAYIISLTDSDNSDYINVYWDSANNLKLTADTGSGEASDVEDMTDQISADSQYSMVLQYENGGDITVSIDGTIELSVAMADTFDEAPDDIYYGSSYSGSKQGDATFSELIVDGTAPSISLTALSPDPNSDNNPSITGTATDAKTTISSVEYQIDGTAGSWTACSCNDGTCDELSEAFTCAVSPALTDGSHTIYVRSTDSAGNTTESGSESQDTFIIDTTAPSISLTAYTPDPTSDTTPTFTGTTTDTYVNISTVEYQMDSTSGSWSACTCDDGTCDSSSESFTCGPVSTLSENGHTIYVRATDSLSNTTTSGSEASDAFSIDISAPTTVEITSQSGENIYSNDTQPNFKWKMATDNNAGVDHYTFILAKPGSDFKDFITIDDIPSYRGEEDKYKKETKKYKIDYLGQTTNNTNDDFILLTLKDSGKWTEQENYGQLPEGKVLIKLKTHDGVGNVDEQTQTLYIDRTAPESQLLQLNDFPVIANFSSRQNSLHLQGENARHLGGVSYSTHDQTPTIYGKITDPLRGHRNPGVSAGPHKITIKIEKKGLLGIYSLHSLTSIKLKDIFWQDNGLGDTREKIDDNTQNISDKYALFQYTPEELEHFIAQESIEIASQNQYFLDALSVDPEYQDQLNLRTCNQFLCEDLLTGDQVTIDGFIYNSEITVFGYTKAVFFPDSNSFSHHDFPYSFSPQLENKIHAGLEKLIPNLGINNSFFNVEIRVDEAEQTFYILEVNSRIAFQFAKTIQAIRGFDPLHLLCQLSIGEKPDLSEIQETGKYKYCYNFELHTFADKKVVKTPTQSGYEEIKIHFPEVHVRNLIHENTKLSDYKHNPDSFRYCVLDIPGNSHQEIMDKYKQVTELLNYEFEKIINNY